MRCVDSPKRYKTLPLQGNKHDIANSTLPYIHTYIYTKKKKSQQQHIAR